MATLWWEWSEYTLSQAAEDIGEVMSGIEAGLSKLGYTNVHNSADVGGLKGDFFVAVKYLPISGRQFWQVIAAGGSGTTAEAQADLGAVATMISKLTFL